MMRGEYTNFDRMRGSVLSSVMRIKELNHLFHRGGIHEIWIENTLKWHWIGPNEGADESIIDPESHYYDCGLQREAALLILNYVHVSIKIMDQSRIDNA